MAEDRETIIEAVTDAIADYLRTRTPNDFTRAINNANQLILKDGLRLEFKLQLDNSADTLRSISRGMALNVGGRPARQRDIATEAAIANAGASTSPRTAPADVTRLSRKYPAYRVEHSSAETIERSDGRDEAGRLIPKEDES
jgi:hypothetical protein